MSSTVPSLEQALPRTRHNKLIDSISVRVRQQTPTSSAEALATAGASEEFGQASPLAAKDLITLTGLTPARRKPKTRPEIPSRTSSSPHTRVVPPRTSSVTGSSVIPSTPAHNSIHQQMSATHYYIHDKLTIDRPERESIRRDTSATPSDNVFVRVNPRARPRATDHRYVSAVRNQPASASSEPGGSDAHAMAIYLRSEHLNRFIELPRPVPDRPLRVSFAEVGNPSGRPILLFLGLGCVRHLIALFDDLAKAFGLRLICIDRWGLGKTENVSAERRNLTEWAEVVNNVLDQIKVDSFQIVAHSAGAPYACATALRLGNRVTGKLYLLAPWVSSDIESGA